MLEGSERGAAIALLQEPYVGGGERMKDYRGARTYQCNGEGTSKAAIAVFDEGIDITPLPQYTTNNIVVVEARTKAWYATLVSFYFEPDKPIEPYLHQLRRMGGALEHKRILIGGDSNARNAWWGSDRDDKRGTELLATLDELQLYILNTGNKPTFDTVRGDKRYFSSIDVTACSAWLLDRVED